MFWVVDNFLMRKNRSVNRKPQHTDNPVQYVIHEPHFGAASDDEVNLHLISNESNDTLMEITGSEYEQLHKRTESRSRSP